jgi:amino acid permease
MNIVIGTAIGSATLTYEVIAVFGYITFGSHVCCVLILFDDTSCIISLQVTANIIEMYPSSSLFVAIGQLAIAILVLFSYPLQVLPCRNCLDKVFHFNTERDKIEDSGVDDEHGSGEMTQLKHTVLTTAVVAGGFSIAYFVDNLEMGEVFSPRSGFLVI